MGIGGGTLGKDLHSLIKIIASSKGEMLMVENTNFKEQCQQAWGKHLHPQIFPFFSTSALTSFVCGYFMKSNNAFAKRIFATVSLYRL